MKHTSAGYPFLLCCFVAETFFATYGLVAGDTALLPSVGYIIAGLLFFVGMLRLPEIRLRQSPASNGRAAMFFKGLLLIVAAGLAALTASYWFDRIDVDPDYADMLPIIKTMNERMLAGHRSQVYDIIPELWGGTRPIYLPAMWMPYAPVLLLKADMRWTTVISLLGCFAAFLVLLRVRWKSVFFWLLLFTSAMLFWWLFAHDDQHGVISLSEEGPVILYYSLLCIALASGNPWFIGAGILCCLMSRYSFAGWLPAYGLILVWRKEYTKMAKIAATVIAGVLLIFLLPFGVEPLHQMLTLPGNYTDFAARVWHDNPETFWVNLGMAKFFGKDHVQLLHHCLVYGSFGLPFLIALFLLLRGKQDANHLPLAMLKLSLVIFYNFVDVPYGYLFYTNTFVSLMIVVMASRSVQDFSEARIA